MTILQSLSFILVATADAENPAKTTECMAPIRAQAKVAIAVQESSVNRYKLDLLFYLVPAIHLPFYKRVGVIQYRKYVMLLR
jgi:hypothetical protein